jgi:hypothetical protein
VNTLGTRGRRSLDPDLQVEAWLIDGAQGELPRDVLVHASLCPDCRRRIAALDVLGSVDLEQAGFPPRHAIAAVEHSQTRRRTAVAAGRAVALSAAAIVAAAAATGWRLDLLGEVGATSSRHRTCWATPASPSRRPR